MRASAVGYMVKRGIVGGTGVFMLLILLTSLLGGSGFSTVVLNGAGNSLFLFAAFYLMFSFIPAALFGGIGGGIIGLLAGFYTSRFVRRHYEQITDADEYASRLAWRVGGLSAALVIAAMALFFSSNLDVMSLVLVAMTVLVGGLTGRGFAYHDMKQRREKKATSKEMVDFQPVHRLELPEDVDNAVFAEGNDSRLRREMEAVRVIK